jgi:hypothetical protein
MPFVVWVRAAANHFPALEIQDELCLGVVSALHIPYELRVIVRYSSMLNPSAV